MVPVTMISQCKCKIHQISKDLVIFFSYLNKNKIISCVQVTQNLSYQRLNNLFFVRHDVQYHMQPRISHHSPLSLLSLALFLHLLFFLLFSIVFLSRLPFFNQLRLLFLLSASLREDNAKTFVLDNILKSTFGKGYIRPLEECLP